MIRISLVIPTHNRAAQLVAALESVVRQDLPRDEWECVVVSNNSTDDTEARFAAFAAAHPGCGLRLVAEEGPGVSYARNRGLREAQAPLVAFIDDDERVNEGFLRAISNSSKPVPGPSWPGAHRRRIPRGTSGVDVEIRRNADRQSDGFRRAGASVPGGTRSRGRQYGFPPCGAGRLRGFDPTLGRVNGELIGGEENDFSNVSCSAARRSGMCRGR